MRVTRDNTGRFPERPFYTERELDQLFERIVTEFLRRRRGAVGFPLTESFARRRDVRWLTPSGVADSTFEPITGAPTRLNASS